MCGERIIKMKALTVPNVLDGTNSSLMEANDLFLLFLCPIDCTVSFPCDRVVLYLHLLGTGEGTKYSVPYRVLTFDYDEFVRGVVVNGCVMPRRFFYARLQADLVNDNLIVRAPNGKTMFSALYMRTVSELEDYYRSVYDDVGDRAFQMYLMAFYYFYYGTDRSFCAVGAVFEKFYEEADDEKNRPHSEVSNALLPRATMRQSVVPIRRERDLSLQTVSHGFF